MEEEIPLPPSNVTHFFVDNEEEDEHEVDLCQEQVPTQTNINSLRLLQQIATKSSTRCEPFVDYTQSQILISDSHVGILHKIT